MVHDSKYIKLNQANVTIYQLWKEQHKHDIRLARTNFSGVQ
jgi:hypothetical protein